MPDTWHFLELCVFAKFDNLQVSMPAQGQKRVNEIILIFIETSLFCAFMPGSDRQPHAIILHEFLASKRKAL